MSNMQQLHGTFVPGEGKAIHGKIQDRTAYRIELVCILAHRFEQARLAHDKDSLNELAAEWDGLGGATTATRIRLLASEM